MDQMKWMLIVVFLIAGQLNEGLSKEVGVASDKDNGGDEYDYNDEDDSSYKSDSAESGANQAIETANPPPYFEDNETELNVRPGENAVLTCNVRNYKVQNVIMWYKGDTIIANDQHPLNNRTETMNNKAIVIKNVREDDAGDYYCVVVPERIRLHVSLRVSSRLAIYCDDRVVTDKSMTFRQGESHVFECRTYGTDNPKIKWSMNGHRAENVVTKIDGGRMFINSIDAQHAGIYQCLADDESLNPPHGMVTIDVQYVPKVSTHRHHVNTREGDRAELYCDYKAQPIAITRWLKNDRALSYSDKYSMKNMVHQHRNRTVLHVKDVTAMDLGEYECHVENTIGWSKANVYLILEPENPQFENMTIDKKRVTLNWLVRSIQPLNEAILDYKLNGAYTWSTVSVFHTKRHADNSNNNMWKLMHEMELVPGSWNARVKTKNTHGWSKFSPSCEFIIADDDDDDDDDDNDDDDDEKQELVQDNDGTNTLDNEIPPQDMVMAAGIAIGKSSANVGVQLCIVPSLSLAAIVASLYGRTLLAAASLTRL